MKTDQRRQFGNINPAYKKMRSFSLLTLIAANLVPLGGVLFYQWDATLILAIFWIENLIIGAFNLTKMLAVSALNKQPKGVFLGAFFVVHYGLFCSAHGLLLWKLLNLGQIDTSQYFSHVPNGPIELFAEGASVFLAFIDMHRPIILLGIGALFLSHFVSFIENFILRAEVFKLDASQLMGQPYVQIFAMHAGLIIGALAIDNFGSTIALLAVMVAFKLAIDIWQHSRRRKKHLDNPILEN